MKEKKEIKIKLSTAISIVIIFALIVVLGIMFYFSFVANKNDNTEKERVSDTVQNNTINVVDESKIESEKNTNYNYKQYEGTWRIKDGMMYGQGIYDEEIKISDINSDKITIVYEIYRTSVFAKENAHITDNIIALNNFKDSYEDETIDATLELKDNEIVLNIKKSNVDTIKKGKRTFVKKDTMIVSKDEAKKIILDSYQKALDIRLSYMSMIKNDKNGLVKNYSDFEKKLDKIFTEDGKNRFVDEWLELLERKNNKVYMMAGDNPLAEKYSSHKIKNEKEITIEDNYISAEIELTTKEDWGDDEVIVEKQTESIDLYRVNGKWLIDRLMEM